MKQNQPAPTETRRWFARRWVWAVAALVAVAAALGLATGGGGPDCAATLAGPFPADGKPFQLAAGTYHPETDDDIAAVIQADRGGQLDPDRTADYRPARAIGDETEPPAVIVPTISGGPIVVAVGGWFNALATGDGEICFRPVGQ